MTGDKNLLNGIKNGVKGNVTFGDDAKGKIIGIGNISSKYSNIIENVLLIENLKFNLISISQICDKNLGVNFRKNACYIVDPTNDNVICTGSRNKNIYLLNIEDLMDQNDHCLNALVDNTWLWHRRLAHISMDYLNDLSSKILVEGLPKTKYVKDRICDACQYGKHIKSSFKTKNLIQSI